MKAFLVLAAMMLTAQPVIAQGRQGGQQSDSARAANARNLGGGQCNRNAYNCVDAKNPLPDIEACLKHVRECAAKVS